MSSKSVLIAAFQTGDVPDGTNYADMINSSVNLDEPTEQSMISSLKTTQLVTPQVSATNVNVTGTLTAPLFSLTTLTATTVSADTGYFNAGVVSGNISVGSLTATGTVSALSVSTTPIVVSAAGTTQATGAALTANGIIRLKGIVNDTTTGFTLLANRTGLQQTLWVEENTSCNLWPCVGGQINALASNAAFPLAGNTQYIVTHIKASGYAVK